jgi:hypothetical protein
MQAGDLAYRTRRITVAGQRRIRTGFAVAAEERPPTCMLMNLRTALPFALEFAKTANSAV